MLATRGHRRRRRCCARGTNVTGPILDRPGRVVGVSATGPDKEPLEFRAPLVIAADGVSGPVRRSRSGIAKREDRPIGVAVRQYFRSEPRHDDDYLESWLELRSRESGDKLLPGYGWIFGLGDGRVNVGLGVLNAASAFGKTNYRHAAGRLGGQHPGGLGPGRPGQRRRQDTGRRAADGLQPRAALHPGRAAGRRLRRHGQPLQRRGHRLRHGVRRAGRGDRGAGAGPADRARRASGRSRTTRPS